MLAPTKVFHNLFTVKIHRKLLLVKNEIRMTIYKMLIVLKIYTTLAQQVLSMTFEGFSVIRKLKNVPNIVLRPGSCPKINW